jgi:hypothetical protein
MRYAADQGSYGHDVCPPGFNFGGAELVPESDVLPLPPAAKGLVVDPETGYALDEIADDTWIITEGVYVCMFVVTSEGVVLFDAPPSLVVRFLFLMVIGSFCLSLLCPKKVKLH